MIAIAESLQLSEGIAYIFQVADGQVVGSIKLDPSLGFYVDLPKFWSLVGNAVNQNIVIGLLGTLGEVIEQINQLSSGSLSVVFPPKE